MNGNSGSDDSGRAVPSEHTLEPETELRGNSTDSGETDGQAAIEEELSVTLSELKSDTGADEQPVMDRSKLSDKQKETLHAIHENPTATQEEIAQYLDVSRATISKRVNSIEGFEWKRRRTFVEQLYDKPAGGGQYDEQIQTETKPSIEELEARISELEARVQTPTVTGEGPSFDPEMTYKIIHACMGAEYFSKEEELKIIRQLLHHE